MESDEQQEVGGGSAPPLCRICVTTHHQQLNSTTATTTTDLPMIPIFGEDALWQKITTLANVKISKNDTLPQQVCVGCAKTAISACVFKKKCEEADNFYRQKLRLQKIEGADPLETSAAADQAKSSGCSSGSGSGSSSASGSGSSSTSSSSSSSDEDEDNDQDQDNDNEVKAGGAHKLLQNGHGQAINGHRDEEDEVQEDMEDHHVAGDDGKQQGDDHDDHHRNGLELRETNPEDEDDVEEINPLSHHHNDDGEITVHGVHPKEPFDFNSIRLMQEYMQHQMNKFPNGSATGPPGQDMELDLDQQHHDDDDDEDMSLPLIPEIELITPGDEAQADPSNPNDLVNGAGVGVVQGMRGPGFQCPHCYQIFEMKQILKAHMQSVHGAPGPVYECSNCRKTYFYKRFLEKHIRRGRCVKKRRNQTRPMQCSDCHVLFPTGHHLGWHKRTGCPSKAAKMPLQQLFKQNIVQFNNFPKRIAAGGARKPTAPELHVNNRKLGLASKRKGRTRIKLDAKKIALAKQLILREATTTVIANELNISRTFAWRLRKSLVNGVSLHERVVDPSQEEHNLQQLQQHHHHQQLQLQQHQQEEQQQAAAVAAAQAEREREHHQLNLSYSHLGLGLIKEERQDSEDEEQHQQHQQHHHPSHHQLGLVDECGAEEIGAEETAGYMGDEDGVCDLLRNGYDPDPDSDPIEHDPFEGTENNDHHLNGGRTGSVSPAPPLPPPSLGSSGVPVPVQVHAAARSDVEVYKRLLAESQHFPHIVNAQQLQMQQQQREREREQREREREQLQQQKAHNGGMPMLTRYPPAVMHALPVNLSLRSMPHMNSNESNGSSSSNTAAPVPVSGSSAASTSATPTGKKPRKPNVFIDDEKYAMAKLLVAQNSSTMEIARALNVSQMTAWKVRDAILKGVPLSYRNKRSDGRHSDEFIVKEQQQQQHQQQQQQQQEQQQRQQEMQRQQQQQMEQMELIKQQRQQQELLLQQQQQQQQQLRHHTPADTSHYQQQQQTPKLLHPRRRLKAAERELRDKEITREILELIKEDSNIQYWKVSARLAEKGINISPSSVCQKLKSMGIHRRWKPGDKPPMLAISQLKAATVAAAAAAASLAGVGGVVGGASAGLAGSSFGLADDSYEQQQFDMGGPHFLSAFTR